MNLKLVNCSVVDALDSNARARAEVHIREDRIVWVGPASSAPDFSEAHIIDLEGGYLLPGLVEAHSHLFMLHNRLPKPHNVAAHTMYCATHAINALKGGFTGLRVLGEGYGVDIALRDSFNQGSIVGPRLWVAGEILTPSAGHVSDREEFWGIRICDGADDWRKAARDQIQAGADYVKLLITGGAIGRDNDVTNAITIVEEELQAAAQVAHSRRKPLIVHATAPDSIMMAIRAGAHSIEHGYFLDEKTAEQMAKSGTYLTPTLTITHMIPSLLEDDYERAAFSAYGRPDWKVKRAEERLEAHLAAFRCAVKAGVKLLVGSDFAPFPAAGHCEMAFMVKAGLTPWQVIVAATQTAAEAVGVPDRLGTVEAGKFADLIAVGENPLEDIRSLRYPKLVLSSGRLAVNQFNPLGVF